MAKVLPPCPIEPMNIPLELAIRSVFTIAAEKIPHVDIWQPNIESSGGFLEPSGRTIRCPPRLMGDDGNLLFAVVYAPSIEHPQKTDTPSPIVRDIRLLGNLLQRAASDYGMHRLLLILALPDTLESGETLASQLADARFKLGQFRVIILPHLNQEFASFELALKEKFELFSPFPEKAFLHKIESSDLPTYAVGVLASGAHQNNPFRSPVESDIQLFLKHGDWPNATSWPETTRALDSILLPTGKAP
ncbi:hypothetical protein [Corallococcus sp. AB045]|uniref:hypothetical protein n=1 Tax=Corallococcus sp. AB045 TaxID=2316719 RepID=UPI0011C36964|nr:hypothetical protein [Corallococcus sp. AB045]